MLTCRINPPLLLNHVTLAVKPGLLIMLVQADWKNYLCGSLWSNPADWRRLSFSTGFCSLSAASWCFMQFQCLRSTSGTMQRNWKQTMMEEVQNAPCTGARSLPSWKPKPWGSGAQWVTCGWCGWRGCPEILLNWMLDIPSCSVLCILMLWSRSPNMQMVSGTSHPFTRVRL